jgi:hypothetical protein
VWSRSVALASALLFAMPRCARIVPHRTEPVPPDSQRIVVAPDDLAVVTSSSQAGALPAMAQSGDRGDGSVVLLVRFPSPWGSRSVAGAFLLLGLHDGAQPDSRPYRVAVARILDPWVGAHVSWGRQPRLAPAEIATTSTGAAVDPLRIDVTEIVRHWAKARPGDHGLAILVSSSGPFAPGYATGCSGRLAPRLDVYLR